MKQKTINILGLIGIPVLLTTLGISITALGDYGNRRAREAVVDRQLGGIELAARDHAASAKRIEATVTNMRVDQAEFVGEMKARIGALEQGRAK